MVDVHSLQLGGIFMDGGAGNNGFYLRGPLTGWDALPDARGSIDSIPGADGSFEETELLRESRAISIPGVVSAGTRAEAEAMWAHAKAMLNRKATLRVTDELGTLSSVVRVDAMTPSDHGAWATWIDFTIDLVAYDPVRYRDPLTLGPIGLPVRSGGLTFPAAFPWHFGDSVRPVGTLTNDGSVPVLPRMTMAGSADSVIVHGGPRRLEFGAFNGLLVLDSLERRAWLNGVDVTRSLVRRDWPVVPPGVSQDFFFEAVNPSPTTVLESVVYKIGEW